jgi:hypothetical protein
MPTSDNQTEAHDFQSLKKKTPAWLYRDFILACFGKKAQIYKMSLMSIPVFSSLKKGIRLTEKQGKQKTFCRCK